MPDDVKPDPTLDPELEGVIEVDLAAQPGQKTKVVPVAALTAERERIRTVEREKHEKELAPLKAKAAQVDQVAADLAAVQPHIEYLKKHPELMKAEEPPAQAAIRDDEAERYARRFELYTATGLDLPRAKAIIADQRAEMAQVAKTAAAEAIRPVAETTALQNSRSNFLWAVQQKDSQGRAVVDPQTLAAEWAKLPATLTADPEVAKHVLRAAIGETALSGKRPPEAPAYEPTFTEAPGGRGSAYAISDLERNVARTAGVSEADWQKTAKTYTPGRTNVIGE